MVNRRLAAFCCGALAACAGGGPATAPADTTPAVAHPGDQTVRIVPARVPVQDVLSPDILLPDFAAGDPEVARIGDLVLRASHAYQRLLAADAKLALSAVDLLVFDILIARHAREFHVSIQLDRVRELSARDEALLAEQVQKELGAGVSLADYVWRIYGMRLDDYRRHQERRTAQRLYQGYVIRYLSLREDRVQVRYIVHQDKALLAELADKVRDGADFATLALRHSDDKLRGDGGLLPPFGRGFPHPVADVAFTLAPGQVSAVVEKKVGDEQRCYLVYCLSRTPGRDVTFAEVAAEIDAELAKRPLSPIEINAYTLRWRGEAERKAADDKGAAGR